VKLEQLLTGAAAAAVLTGSAVAQTVTTSVTASDFVEGVDIAAEYTGDLSGNLILDLDFDDAFVELGTLGRVDMVITLTNAEFSAPVAAAPDFADSDCDFVIHADGKDGDATITYRSANGSLGSCANVDDGDGEDEAETTLSLPIEVSTPGSVDGDDGESVSARIEFVRVSGSATYTGRTISINLIDYVAATGYTYTANPEKDDLLVTGGTRIFWADAVAADNPGWVGDFSADKLGEVDIDLDGEALGSYDTVLANDSEVIFSFEDFTNITGMDFTRHGGECREPDAAANTVTCLLTGAQVDSSVDLPIAFFVHISATLPVVAPQNISVEFKPSTETGWTDEGIASTPSGVLDEDDGVGITSIGHFPWTSLRPSGGTRSVFRITGLKAMPTEIAVNLGTTYVREGGTAPTSRRGVITGVDVREDALNKGEYIATFTSEDMAAALGSAGGVNADVSFDVTLPDGTETGTLQIIRLLSTAGVVNSTSFDSYSAPTPVNPGR